MKLNGHSKDATLPTSKSKIVRSSKDTFFMAQNSFVYFSEIPDSVLDLIKTIMSKGVDYGFHLILANHLY